MSDMKCPICGNVLEQSDGFSELFMCLNCQINMKHNQWQELIRTRKALDVAVDALKVYGNQENWDFEHFYLQRTYEIAGNALEQITALEQKE